MHSTDPTFSHDRAREIREALIPLRRMDSIEAFYELTREDNLIWNVPCTALSWSPELRATVLAALGRLDEASGVAEEIGEKADEPGLLATIAENEALLARRPRSGDAKYRIETAQHRIRRLQGTKRLRELAGAGDRAAIGALLRSWEEARVRDLDIEHLWEPTPFPVELA